MFVFAARESGRKLLKVENYQKPVEEISSNLVADFDCDADLGQTLEPNQSVAFEHDDWEIALDVPFNNSWGGEKFRLLPYEVTTAVYPPGIYFGPVRNGYSNCGFFRYYHLSKEEPMSVQSFIDGLKEYYNWNPNADYNELLALPKVEEANGVMLTSYQLGGKCVTSHVMIFGKDNNYLLEGACESFSEVEDLLEVARTVRIR